MSRSSTSEPRPQWLAEVQRIDRAVYTAVATTPTPQLDDAMRRLSRAADHSKISIALGALLALGGGASGRRAAASGLIAVAATSAVVNVAVKPLARRRRPDRAVQEVPEQRHVRMPNSRSFPSGHAATAVAFASAAGQVLPAEGFPLRAVATLVGYSRVHTGVHYPGDVVGGALLGAVIADLTSACINRTWPLSPARSSPLRRLGRRVPSCSG